MQDGDWTIRSASASLFSTTNHGKLDKKGITNAIVNFYPTEELIAAEEQLVKEAAAMKLGDMPRLQRRRDCENRDQYEIDDIFGIISFHRPGRARCN